MPRITSYTPAWLSRPSPGFDFFNKLSSSPGKGSSVTANGNAPADLSRTLARRGTQVFAVVGNELRWSDLVLLKEEWETQRRSQRRRADKSHGSISDAADDEEQKSLYRVLKVPVSRKIRQIIMSPAEDYLAIITSHTAHIAVLPDASNLASEDMSDLKLKVFQLGPTVHVMERSPIAAVLWHPLGAQGSCLVTITADAVVRLWELDRKNRWSFDEPALGFDLKKLVDGETVAEDFSPSKYWTSKGFSPDSFELEVASAAFGGMAHDGEPPWSSMTLWVAMKAGDIYALCPLLPSKWHAPAALTASLAFSVQCHAALLDEKDNVSKQERRITDQQLSWVTEIERQQHAAEDVFLRRPSNSGSIPKLQGPFQLAPDPDQLFEITDIYVLSPTVVDEDPEIDTELPIDPLASSLDLVCVTTSDSNIHICANLKTIGGAWLPLRQSSRLVEDEHSGQEPELLVVESIKLSKAPKSCSTLITPDAQSHDSIFITHSCGVSHLDLNPLTSSLLNELNGGTGSGANFRIGMLVEESRFHIDHLIDIRKKQGPAENMAAESSTCVDFLDADLGHFLLAVFAGQAHAVTLDDTAANHQITATGDADYETEAEIQGLIGNESRPSYQPPDEFWAESTLASFMEQHVHSRGRRFMSDEVRISPTTLNLLMEAHRILSHETHRLGVAAADLFSHCERLRDEFSEQITRARDVAERVDAVLGNDADPYEEENHNSLGTSPLAVADRLELVKAQQETLQVRYEELRRRVGGLNGRPLNDKEKAWIAEVEKMDELIRPPADDVSSSLSSPSPLAPDGLVADRPSAPVPSARFEHVKRLQEHLVAQSREIEQAPNTTTMTTESDGAGLFNIAPERRRMRLAEIDVMLERQTALVEATRGKLERLDRVSA